MARRERKKRRLPTEPISVTVRDLAHDGRGIGQSDGDENAGKTVFVHGALPDEKVRAKLIGRTRQFDEGVTEEVLESSKDRVVPDCPWFEQCGGCALLHMSHDAQIEWKHKRLVDNLQRIGGVTAERWAEPIRSAPYGYRRRARLSVRHVAKKGRVLVGFREKQGRFVADVTSCLVLHEKFSNRLEALSELIGELSIPQAIPQIEIAVGDEDAALILRHLEPLTSADLMRLHEFHKAHGIAIYLQSKGPDTIHCLTDPAMSLSYSLPEWDVSLAFQPQQFIQVNAAINAQLVSKAIQWLELGSDDRVLDLFCGLGNFTLPMARVAAEVVGVEGAQDLVDSARNNAARNKISNAVFHAADLTLDPDKQPFLREAYDAVLIDPPRSGAEDVLPLVAKSGTRRVVYVSCNPATLARDAGLLVAEHGYRLVEAGVADMFPHTAHVESMALFVKP